MKKLFKRFAVLILTAVVLCAPVSALENTNAYISAGGAHIANKGGGNIAVEFTVMGTYIMDEIGAHKVTVYKMLGSEPNAATDDMVKSFYYTNYPDMMGAGLGMYSGSVDLTVESGDYYAVIMFYASLDGGGAWMPYGTDVVTV